VHSPLRQMCCRTKSPRVAAGGGGGGGGGGAGASQAIEEKASCDRPWEKTDGGACDVVESEEEN
jgi:hypothetical protein